MKTIETTHYPIFFGSQAYEKLATFVQEKNYSRIFVMVDEHTHEFCAAYFLQQFPAEVELIEISAGEENKHLHTCLHVWEALSELGADRKSLLINLGGGVVTDLGGFVASTFMRGIDFINIPTSLLAMVDASVGGKVGVDLGVLKNQVGVINNPKMLLIDVAYLATLPPEELRSGLAEMFKHGLIAERTYWEQLTQLSRLSPEDLEGLIYQSVVIKNTIVEQDPCEQNLRKVLNFGHTLGHAIESFCMDSPTHPRLLHGHCVALGMMLATRLSQQIVGLPAQTATQIQKVLSEYFPWVDFSQQDITQIIALLRFDKKNTHGQTNFVLLEEIARPVMNVQVSPEQFRHAFTLTT